MEIDQQEDLVAAWWKEMPEDFQLELLVCLPVESVSRYAMVCKEWNDLLSSNYFITRWAKAHINEQKPRLVVCHTNPNMPSMAFCFYTRTWIKSCFNLSFLNVSEIRCRSSVAGHFLVDLIDESSSIFRPLNRRMCNPYTRKLVEIPTLSNSYSECIVRVEENNNGRSHTALKVVAVKRVFENGRMQRLNVNIYEPSQKRWNFAGYIQEDYPLEIYSALRFVNGSFYFSAKAFEDVHGILIFSIPLQEEGNGSAAERIPVLFAPYSEMVRNDPQVRVSGPNIIVCGSRLVIIVIMGRAYGLDNHEEEVIIIWELKIVKDGGGRPSWEWVEIARMPNIFHIGWENKKFPGNTNCLLPTDCIGVGDHVCFVPSSDTRTKLREIEVLTYNLVDNTWNWLPPVPKIHGYEPNLLCTDGRMFIAFEPNLNSF